jgi:hypothetical protein
MHRLLVDFNDIDDEIVVGLDRDMTGPQSPSLQQGDRVRLHDDGEHEAWGVVVEVDGELISAEMDRSTWGPAGHIRVIQMIPGNHARAWIEAADLLESGWVEGDNRATLKGTPQESPPALPQAA